MNYDNQYRELTKKILEEGEDRSDRTGVGTYSLFGEQMNVDISERFPLLTLKKTPLRLIAHELLWFLNIVPEKYRTGKHTKSNTNIKYLVDNNVNIWNEWPYEKYKLENGDALSLKDFVEKIKEDDYFAHRWGNLGPVYGKQWTDWGTGQFERKPKIHSNFFMEGEKESERVEEIGLNQIQWAIDRIIKTPTDRGIIVNAWNVKDLPDMALRPCHTMFQFYVRKGQFLDVKLYQRSCDFFLGAPFNFASYALLNYMISELTSLKPGRLIITYGDVHLYKNHVDQAKELIDREPKELPKLKFTKQHNSLNDFDIDSFDIIGYNPHPAIKAPIAV